MELDNFDAAFAAAQEVALKGETLVCIGLGKTVALRPITSEAKLQIEMVEIDGTIAISKQRFDVTNYPVRMFTHFSVAPHYQTLLKGGTNVIGK